MGVREWLGGVGTHPPPTRVGTGYQNISRETHGVKTHPAAHLQQKHFQYMCCVIKKLKNI